MTVLAPRLTALDERVLAALRECGPCRAREVAVKVYGTPVRVCPGCGRWEHTSRLPTAAWVPGSLAGALCYAGGCRTEMRRDLRVRPEQVREVREILGGLERVGLAQHSAGGWWRA